MTDNARILADYRPSEFSIEHVDLTFELHDHQTIVTNTMQITRTVKGDSPLVLDGEHLKLVSVIINGVTVAESDYQITSSSLTLITELMQFELSIVTQIDPKNNKALEGLYKSGGAFCTQCEAEGFRRITYYLDRPDVMAIFTTKVIADKKAFPYLLANGNNIESGDFDDARHFVTWHDPFPKPCYLFALVAGDFDCLRDSYTTTSGRDVSLEIFVDKGNLSKAHHAMTSLKKSMKWDEDVFGLEYDLDIYMIVAVDFFNMGAMENKGLNIFNSKYVLADQKSATDTDYFNIEAVIAHEYFHNWTGNRVTCRDWFQLSLKEGLTVFRDQQFSADMHSASVCRIKNVDVLRSAQFAEDAGPMAHPIRPEKVLEMNNFYTLTVYEKGAEVIRMMHTLLGQAKFRRGMDLYFERFDGMAVTCDDFVDAMADASGVDLSQFKRWYSQSGTPMLKVSELFDEQSKTFSLTIEQINTPTDVQPDKKDLHIPIHLELIGEQKEQHLLELKSGSQTWHFDGYQQAPLVAILGNFSAPVKLEYPQSQEKLSRLMVEASDAFNRWDAGVRLMTGYIKQLVDDRDFKLPESLIESLAKLFEDVRSPALLAEQLTVPSFDELVEHYQQIDPQALIAAIDQVELAIAQGLEAKLLNSYQQYSADTYKMDGLSIEARALKNRCLYYLAKLNKYDDLVNTQYKESDNMTDTLAALKTASNGDSRLFDELSADFESQWREDTLVLDKWFSIQASWQGDNVFERLEKLEQHSLFTIENPNRARSLIGAFAMANPRHFHSITGQGYQFLAKYVKKLDAINPQVASRLITPLLQFKRFDSARQQMMKSELEQLGALPKLSKDLTEKLNAALK